jgi:anti-sigma factor RsiW
MTMHPGSDVLLAHADGELPDDDDELVRHIEQCTECSAAVARLRDDSRSFAAALRALDEAEPRYWARDEEVVVLPLAARSVRVTPAMSRSSGGLRWAAGILLVAGAAVSAAVVGARILSDANEGTVPASEPATAQPGVAAVMMSPVGGQVVVAVSGAGTDSRLFVTFADRPDASVAVEGAGSPRFRAVDGRVDLDLAGASAVVRVTLPQSLRRATIAVDDTTIATVRDGQVTPPAAAGAGIPLDIIGPRMQ